MQHPRPESPDPDVDVVRGCGAPLGAGDPVKLTIAQQFRQLAMRDGSAVSEGCWRRPVEKFVVEVGRYCWTRTAVVSTVSNSSPTRSAVTPEHGGIGGQAKGIDARATAPARSRGIDETFEGRVVNVDSDVRANARSRLRRAGVEVRPAQLHESVGAPLRRCPVIISGGNSDDGLQRLTDELPLFDTQPAANIRSVQHL